MPRRCGRWHATQQQVIAVDNAGLSLENLAALRESVHEQCLFRQEQLQQIRGASQTRAAVRFAGRGPHQVRRLRPDGPRRCGSGIAAYRSEPVRQLPRCTRPLAVEQLRIVPQARTAPAVSRSERRDGTKMDTHRSARGDYAQTVTLRTGGRS